MSMFVSVKSLLVQQQLDHLLVMHLLQPAQLQNGPDLRSQIRSRNAIFCMQKSRSFFQTNLKLTREFLQPFFSKKILSKSVIRCVCLLLILNCVLCWEECEMHCVMHCVLTAALTSDRHCNFCYFSAWKFIRNFSTRCTSRLPRKLCLYGLQGLCYLRIGLIAKAIRSPKRCIICPFKFKALCSSKKP